MSGKADKPLVASCCGTFLKKEMQSIYRQVVNLRAFRSVVFTEKEENRGMFPLGDVVTMKKLRRPKARGNFVLRFWYKHIVKKWPPPRQITTERPFYPYTLHLLLKQQNVDVAHVYYGHKAVKYLSMLQAWGGPFVVSFHGVDLVKFVGQEGYADNLRDVFTHAQLVLARSESLLDGLRNLGCPGEKLRLNRTPIPLEAIPSAVRCGPGNGQWKLIQACRLIPKKGLFTALKALPAVLERFPKAKFIVCGTGPEEGRLRRAVAQAGLDRNVELTGWKTQPELLKLYGESHIFLHPSELTEFSDQEGVPNSMLEAMAAGLPVVATRHGGIPEAVTHGADGLLVAERDSSALSTALIDLMSDEEELARFSNNAAESVRAQFGMEAQIVKLEQCYREAMEIHHAAG